MDNKAFALSLAACESETDIISLLEKLSLWDNPLCWRAFGDNDNNWSTIGNQQSDADAALVEKIVNSVDALLMKECMVRGIAPDSDKAPKSIAAALEEYFGITGGKLQNLTESERTGLAQNNIILAATGQKGADPNIVIVDRGEGQSPNRMPDTILSINKSNKLKVPFVQGKFNMGGTGALCFCGYNNFQLIICRRCPDINSGNDDSHNLWGFTIIRRERPSEKNGSRSSKFTYLTDEQGSILSFEANDGIEIIPTSKGKKDVMEYGMFCKMFEYKMPSRLRTNINMNLYTRLSMLLPNLAYPVYLDECREGFDAHTMHRTLSGLNVRLSDQFSKGETSNIEDKVTVSFTIDGQKVDAAVYIFKKKNGKKKNGDDKEVDMSQYRGVEGILLTQNGQTHGSYDKKFYNRSSVGLSYLSESLLTIVDCTGIDEATREELFMNSRDRTRSSVFATKLESFLEEYLKENELLKQIQQRRREEALSDKLDDEKPLEDVLSSVFKSSSVLSRLFVFGKKLQNPVNLGAAQEADDFEGKYNPTFFTIIRKKNHVDGIYTREAQLDRKFRIRFKTDACNDFFSREKYPGTYILTRDNETAEDHIVHLHNGIATLSVELPDTAKIGDAFKYRFVITDTNVDRDFENEFEIHIVGLQDTTGGHNGRRTPPNGENSEKDTFKPSGISLPKVEEIYKDRWDECGFTKESALVVKKYEEAYDFFVNMDNIHLQTEIKPIVKNEGKMKLLKARYKYSMVLIGLGVLGYYDNHQSEESGETVDSPEEMIKKISDMLSPVLLPMIDVMGDDMSDILN